MPPLTHKEIARVTALPVFWFFHLQERLRFGIPRYRLGDGDSKVIRFGIEEVFRWAIARPVPRAVPLPGAS